MLYVSADNTSHIPDEEEFQDTTTVSLPVTTADTPVGEAGPEKQAILCYTICIYVPQLLPFSTILLKCSRQFRHFIFLALGHLN